MNNGYYNYIVSSESVPTVAPGQTIYYCVVFNYTNSGSPVVQPSTTLSLVAGGNGYSVPSVANLKFPAWIEWPDDPWVRNGYGPISPSIQLRVVGEAISLTNSYGADNDLGLPTYQWRKNGVPVGLRQSFTPDPYVPDQTSTAAPVLTISNAQPSDAGVYDVDVRGNNWFIGQKIYVSIQTTNGPGIFKAPKFIGTNFVCDLAGAAGRSYKVQQSTNLLNWSDLVTLSNANGTVTFTNAPPGSGPRFYRTILVSQ